MTHELLVGIEARGSHASGFAFTKGEESAVYKNPVPGSQLSLGELPRRAETVILHTRFATQGKPEDNRNNHPVMSPDNTVALVHNGVISNDYTYRKEYGGEFEGLADVDSSVIPAVIQKYGPVKGVEGLEGYAALAWLDSADHGTMNLARVASSPVAYTNLYDGTFVFASTPEILRGSLRRARLDFGAVFTMSEGEHFLVRGGVIRSIEPTLKMEDDIWARYRYGSATAGGKKADSGTTTVGATISAIQKGKKVTFDDTDFQDAEKDSESCAVSYGTGKPAMALESNGTWVADPETGEFVKDDDDLRGYYLTHWDGDLQYFSSLGEMEKHMDWLANLAQGDTPDFPDVEHKLRWVNQIVDMGHISSSHGMESWLEDLALIDEHESPAVYNLDYVRDGLGMMIQAMTS